MWQQEMYKLFDTQTKRIIVVLFFLFAVTMGAIIGYSFTGVFMKAFLNGDERSLGLLVVSMAINASIFTSLLFVLIKVRTPEQDRFSMQLSWFPLSTFQKSFGYFIPMVTVVAGLVLFLSAFCFYLILLPRELVFFYLHFLFDGAFAVAFCLNAAPVYLQYHLFTRFEIKITVAKICSDICFIGTGRGVWIDAF